MSSSALPHPIRDILTGYNQILDGSDQLKDTETANTNWSGGYDPYVDLLNGDTLTNSGAFQWLLFTNLKKFYISKFQYIGNTDDIDFLKMEEHLFRLGRVCIIKWGGKLVMGDYKLIKHDLDYTPEIVNFVPIADAYKQPKEGQKVIKKVLKDPKDKRKNMTFRVGKDCVIINNGPPFSPTSQNEGYTLYIKTLHMVQILSSIHNQLIINMKTARSVIAFPSNLDKKILQNIQNALLGSSPIIPLGDIDSEFLKEPLEKALLEFKDRTNEIIDTYNHYLEMTLSMLGCDSVKNEKKKERLTPIEIEVTNQFSRGINETERLYRQQGLDMFNKVFNLQISCVIRTEQKLKEMIAFESSMEQQNNEGGDNNE